MTSGLDQVCVRRRLGRVRRIADAAIEHANTNTSESACKYDEIVQIELNAEAREQREACAKHVELKASSFQRLAATAILAGTKQCCRCMTDNLTRLATEMLEQGGKA